MAELASSRTFCRHGGNIFRASTRVHHCKLEISSDIVSVLKYNKLRRENQELKRLLGEITLEMSLGKKN